MTKKLHKTLLILVLVFIPPYFLLFTDEGNRISDNAVLWLFGQKDLTLNLEQASSNFTDAEIRQVFNTLKWQCGTVNSRFGSHACNAVIGAFNDLPARHAVMFFAHHHLSAIKVTYRKEYHNALLAQLIQTLGQPRNIAQAISAGPDTAKVLEWDTGKGLVVLKKTIGDADEPALIWIATGQPANPAKANTQKQ